MAPSAYEGVARIIRSTHHTLDWESYRKLHLHFQALRGLCQCPVFFAETGNVRRTILACLRV
eukprot:36398-Karenia_brevis.AAC.1